MKVFLYTKIVIFSSEPVTSETTIKGKQLQYIDIQNSILLSPMMTHKTNLYWRLIDMHE